MKRPCPKCRMRLINPDRVGLCKPCFRAALAARVARAAAIEPPGGRPTELPEPDTTRKSRSQKITRPSSKGRRVIRKGSPHS